MNNQIKCSRLAHMWCHILMCVCASLKVPSITGIEHNHRLGHTFALIIINDWVRWKCARQLRGKTIDFWLPLAASAYIDMFVMVWEMAKVWARALCFADANDIDWAAYSWLCIYIYSLDRDPFGLWAPRSRHPTRTHILSARMNISTCVLLYHHYFFFQWEIIKWVPFVWIARCHQHGLYKWTFDCTAEWGEIAPTRRVTRFT